jgi:hypothetical protein
MSLPTKGAENHPQIICAPPDRGAACYVTLTTDVLARFLALNPRTAHRLRVLH